MNIMISKQLQKLRCDILFWDYYCFLFMFITNSKYILKLLEPSTFACDTNLLYFAEYICNSNCYCKPWNYESVNFSSANLHVKTKLQVFISDEFGLMQKTFFLSKIQQERWVLVCYKHITEVEKVFERFLVFSEEHLIYR